MSVAARRLNEFHSVPSKESDLPVGDKLVAKICSYDYVLQFTNDGVRVLCAKEYVELPDDLLELRAFNESGELHLVNADGVHYGRVREDGVGDLCTVFDECHRVWGSSVTTRDDELLLREDRGTEVRLSASAARSILGIESVTGRKGEERYAALYVRNYLDERSIDPESGDTGFSFVDYRLVGFEVKDDGKHGKEV